MLITRATEYAVRCALYLAAQPPDRIVPRHEIAQAMDIPVAFLAKITQRLARVGIFRIVQGVCGGCRLLLPAQRLTLLAVVEAAEGEIGLNKCVLDPKACSSSDFCAVHPAWSEARRLLRESLGAVTFVALAAKERAGTAAPVRRRPGADRGQRAGR